MTITLPDFSLVVLVGASGSGKSTFARTHFRPTEVVSSDALRGAIADDETDQSASRDAFEVLHLIAAKRLAGRRLTVVDATSVQPEARRQLLSVAHRFHAVPVAIVLDVPADVCHARNQSRPDRRFGPEVVRAQRADLERSLPLLEQEGFHQVHVLGAGDVDAVEITRQPLSCDRRDDPGPFDVVGDVHGCLDELRELLDRLGYQGDPPRHPAGRRVVFLGDLVDRGPAIAAVLRLAMSMVAAGSALCLPGNHEVRLLRKLRGDDVKIRHGLARTLEQLAAEPPSFAAELEGFFSAMTSHYVLAGGALVAAHAGMKEAFQGRASRAVDGFALYGETTGETDAYGLPVRHNWAASYRGRALVVYGHTPVLEAELVNNTLCIDTGCVYGGKLTALRWPEQELVAVPAHRTYVEPVRPLG